MKRADHDIICGIVEPGSRVLDLGCGAGDLLARLVRDRNVSGYGIELNETAVYACVDKGLSVFHGDMETGLSGYPDKSFDYVILNQSMQEARNVAGVIGEALRTGKKVVVGFPNFAYIRARCRLFFKGKAPVTASLPYLWYDTPNMHFLSFTDFEDFCRAEDIAVVAKYFIRRNGQVRLFPNLLADSGVFVIEE